MYTNHGHQIPGTTVDYPPGPPKRERCGGILHCTKCIGEAYHATLVYISPEDPIRRVSWMDNTDNQVKARSIVANYYNDILREDSIEVDPITLKEVHIVWFSKTLKNWKALVTTEIPDNIYYEVTYNGAKGEIYLDIYHKTDNVIIRDKETL